MIVMLTDRNNKYFKGLSVVLAVMILVLSLPFTTQASVSQETEQAILEMAISTNALSHTEGYIRVYITTDHALNWNKSSEWIVRAVNDAEAEDVASATDATAPYIGADVGKQEVIIPGGDAQTQVDINGKMRLVYYIDVPKGNGIFAHYSGHGTSKVMKNPEEGALYCIKNVSDDIGNQSIEIVKVADSLTTDITSDTSSNKFTVKPATRTTFCVGDEISFVLTQDDIISPVNLDLVYQFYYAEHGTDSWNLIPQEDAGDGSLYWDVDNSKLMNTNALQAGTQYDIIMKIIDGYTVASSKIITLNMEEAGSLTLSATGGVYVQNGDNKTGTIYYSNNAEITVETSNVNQYAYIQDATESQLEMTGPWANATSTDETGINKITLPSTPTDPTHYTATSLTVRGYNADGDIIQEKTINLICDTKAPEVEGFTLFSGDPDTWKTEKELQIVLRDSAEGEDIICGSGISTDPDNLYLENKTNGKITRVTSYLEGTDGDKTVTVRFKVYESGEYVVHYQDKLGNSNTSSAFDVQMVDSVAPVIENIKVDGEPIDTWENNTWEKEHEVTFTINNNVTDKEYADGQSPITTVGYYFLGENGDDTDDITMNGVSNDGGVYKFAADQSGKYRIYIADQTGNSVTADLNIGMVDKDAPYGEISINTDSDNSKEIICQDPANEAIDIVITNLKDIGTSGIDKIEYFFDYDYLSHKDQTPLSSDADIRALEEVIVPEGCPEHGTIDMSNVTPTSGTIYEDVTVATINTKVNANFRVYAIITDRAGNTYNMYSSAVIIDSIEPTVKVEVKGTNKDDTDTTINGWFNKNVDIKITVSDDNGSGIQDVRYLVKNTNNFEPDESGYIVINANADGTYELNNVAEGDKWIGIAVRDNAGNLKITPVEIKLDNTDPTLSLQSDNVGKISIYEPVKTGTIKAFFNVGASDLDYLDFYLGTDDNGEIIYTFLQRLSVGEAKTENEKRYIECPVSANGNYKLVCASKSGLVSKEYVYEVSNIDSVNPDKQVVNLYTDEACTQPYTGNYIDKNIYAKVSGEITIPLRTRNLNFKIDSDDPFLTESETVWQVAFQMSVDGNNWENVKVINELKGNDEAFIASDGTTPKIATGTQTYVAIINLNELDFGSLSLIEGNEIDSSYYFRVELVELESADTISHRLYNVGPTEYIDKNIKYDNKAPTDLSVSYSEFVIDKFLEIISFGIYTGTTMKVTMTAKDGGAGVAGFIYTLTDSNGTATPYQVGKDEITYSDDGTATCDITISKPYEGNFTFSVIDDLYSESNPNKANHITGYGDEDYIVIDQTEPSRLGISVTKGDEKNPITSGDLSNKYIEINLTTLTQPVSGVKGYYIAKGSADASKVKLENSEDGNIVVTTEKISVPSKNGNQKKNTVTSAVYKVTADTDDTYYFFVQSNAGLWSDPVEFKVNVDTTAPVIQSFEFDSNVVKQNEVEIGSYGFFFNTDTTVTVTATDDGLSDTRTTGSGVKYIYVMLDGILNGTAVTNYMLTSTDGSTDVSAEAVSNAVTVTIPANFKGNISAYAVDVAENSGETKSPHKLIGESSDVHGAASNHIAITPKDGTNFENGNYANATNGVDMNVVVTDTMSGIASLEWKIIVDGQVKESGTVETDIINGGIKTASDSADKWTVTSDINLVTVLSRTFNVKYDSNNIVIKVNMTDNAGNTSELTSSSINIDTTAPVINVSYSNNNAKNSKYFNANRILMVEIDEFNFTQALANNVSVALNRNGELMTFADGFVYDENTHKATWQVTLDEGVYELVSITCTDLAGNAGVWRFADGTVAQQNFVIDKQAPIVKVAYDNNSNIDGYFASQRKLTVTVSDFGLVDNISKISDDIKLDITMYGTKQTISNINSFVIADQTKAGAGETLGTATWEYTFSADGIYTVALTDITDKAGNVASVNLAAGTVTTTDASGSHTASITDDGAVNACPESFVIDTVAPTVTIQYIDKVTVQDPHYFSDYRTALITVNDVNFDPNSIMLDNPSDNPIVNSILKVKDLGGNDVNNAYINKLISDFRDNVFEDGHSWQKNGDKYTIEVKLGWDDTTDSAVNGIFDFNFVAFDKAGNKSGTIEYKGSNISDNGVNTHFVVDSENPTDLKIKIEPLDTVNQIFNILTFGIFSNGGVKVTLQAKDALAGVGSFTYTIDYDKIEGSIYTGSGTETVTVNSSNITYDGNIATYTFTIKDKIVGSSTYEQFRGAIKFFATDRAGCSSVDCNQVYLSDTNSMDSNLIIDTIDPVISVSFDNNNSKKFNGVDYYDANRTLTVQVTETNFFAEDVKIDILDAETNSPLDYSIHFDENTSGATPVYTFKYIFSNDGHYKLKVTYTDRSGNNANINNSGSNVYEEEFIIDKIAPKVVISYNKNSSSLYYDSREATIVVEEKNFENIDNDTFLKILASNIGGGITAPTLVSNNGTVWKTLPDNKHQATVKFDADGTYELVNDTIDDLTYIHGIHYVDPAGNSAVVTFDDDVLNGEIFSVDTKAPDNVQIQYNTNGFTKLLNVLTGNLFFKETVTVTIRADEEVSGIDKIEYICNLSDGVSSINKPVKGVINTADIKKLDATGNTDLTYTYEATFSIEPQYRGYVQLIIYDKAGNVTSISDGRQAIVDSKSPAWGKISYTCANGDRAIKNGNLYFNETIVGTVTVNEANFDLNKNEFQFVIKKDGTTYSGATLKWSGPVNDVYTGTFSINKNAGDGKYVVYMKYTDVSGNVINNFDNKTYEDGWQYISTPLILDTQDPVFTVSYDNNDVKNDAYFSSKRVATLVVTDKYLDSNDIKVSITPSDTASITSWTTSGDRHTAKITFERDSKYTLRISCMDLAENEITIRQVDFGSSAKPNDFYVDKVAPTGKITVGEWSASVNGTIWEKLLSAITFGLYSRDDLSVTIESSDNLSGVNSVGYLTSTTRLSQKDLESRTDWKKGTPDKTVFTVTGNNQFIVYAKIMDRAENTTYISSDGIIIDQVKPQIDGVEPITEISLNDASDQPEYDASGNMLFNGDVVLNIKVTDVSTRVNGVDVYSGLSSVTYQVISNGVETQSGTLTGKENVQKSSTTGLIYSQSDIIRIDADRNNTNDIRLIVTAIDNVGNRTVEEQGFIIDTTNPTIEVSYNNDTPDTMGAFFKNSRTATITITERNFDPAKVDLAITTVGGKVPTISQWSTIEGSTPDDTRHRATLVYSDDGDYTFDISYVDSAGNKAPEASYGSSVAPKAFTIDRTLPLISITYNNNSVANKNYYSSARTATITIVEHNFETSRVKITGTASDDGITKTFPAVSQWTTSGDVHTATITFTDDAEYKFVVDYTDKAGNVAQTSAEQDFYIDNKNPVATISGVENEAAYGNGSLVAPVITFSDTNFDASTIKITLTGATLGSVDVKGTFSDITNGTIFTFDNIEAIKSNDDIYTLVATVQDLSGRTYTTPACRFSVNRFGSTYEVEEDTKKLVETYYVCEVDEDVIIFEYNVDDIEDYSIEISINGNDAKTLIENVDYTVEKEHSDGKWTKYTYKILKEVFAEEATYAIVLKSKDGADNSAYSDLTNTDLQFIVDRTAPTVAISGVVDHGRYKVETQTVKLLVKDDNKLGSLKVIINGGEKELTWTLEELEKLNGEITFTLDNSTETQSIQVICVDAATNETTVEVIDILITTSTFVQMYNNSLLFYILIGILGLIILTIIIIIIVKRKKDDEEEEVIDVEALLKNS